MERATVREVLLQLESNRKRLLKPYFQEIGLTLGQGQPRILNTLLKKDHISQRELADQCEMDVTNMSRTLDRMVEAGFLTRERKPGCRRSYLIVLTEFGRKKAEEVHRGFKKVDEIPNYAKQGQSGKIKYEPKLSKEQIEKNSEALISGLVELLNKTFGQTYFSPTELDNYIKQINF